IEVMNGRIDLRVHLIVYMTNVVLYVHKLKLAYADNFSRTIPTGYQWLSKYSHSYFFYLSKNDQRLTYLKYNSYKYCTNYCTYYLNLFNKTYVFHVIVCLSFDFMFIILSS